MSKPLKPLPCCGVAPKVCKPWRDWQVYCMDYGCEEHGAIGRTRKEAVSRWNASVRAARNGK